MEALRWLDAEKITRKSGSNFLVSFWFLPREKRQAIYVVYAFCRQTDDIVDNDALPLEHKISLLDWWEKELKQAFTRKVSGYFQQLLQVAERFRIPLDYFLQLIEGVRMDLQRVQFRTFEDLKLYCYRVASSVGLMTIQIFGYRDPMTRAYAENLGIALQLTNILRDVGKDARCGRIYLPQEDLQRFHVGTEDIQSHRFTPQFAELMRFEASRARHFYRLASETLPEVDRKNMLVAEMMRRFYFTILKRIEAIHYNVLEKKVHLSLPRKLAIALQTLWEMKLLD